MQRGLTSGEKGADMTSKSAPWVHLRFPSLFSCPICMFLYKGKMLFFHSLITQRLFGCFMSSKIKIFLKAMLDYSDFYLLQQLWVEILQLQGCQMRVLLEFLFHHGVSQSKCLLLPLPNLCLGTVLFGSSLAAAKSLLLVAFPLPLCSYV